MPHSPDRDPYAGIQLTEPQRRRLVAAARETDPGTRQVVRAVTRHMVSLTEVQADGTAYRVVIDSMGGDAGAIVRVAATVDIDQDLDTSERIIRAVRALERHDVSIADVRDAIADVPRVEFERTVLDLRDRQVLDLAPEPDRRSLTFRQTNAAMRLGGQDKHLIGLRRPGQ